jgi:diguanylate cyclase (GGDEF)-like protein/PAS domain S-box-containing protein
MRKDNISIVIISSNAQTIETIQSHAKEIAKHKLSLIICENDFDKVQESISKVYIDLVIFDIDALDEGSCFIAHLLLEKKISILFLLSAQNIEHLIQNKFNFHLVDYLIKPMPDAVLRHKVEIYLQNIKKQKSSENLLSLYDENVIASETDLKGRITYASKAFCEISGYSQEELIGKAHNIVRDPETPASVYEDMWKTIQSGNQWYGEVKNLKKNGGFYWVKVAVSPEFDYNGKIIGYSSIRQDISSQKYIEQASLIDYLTQLYNKKYFDETLEKELYAAARYKYHISLLILDIDHFKNVNDTFGHLAGDTVLKEFASVLLENTRKSDIVTRIGGEEFAIIVSNDTEESACAFARKLRQEIEKHLFEIIKNVTVSIGISSYKENDTAQTLFQRVDDAMYKAKHNGRNQVIRL